MGAPSGAARREELREALQEALGVPSVFLVSSARAGLLWLLERVAARHPGAEVVLWNYNFFAVPDMVRLAGLTPVLVDSAGENGEPSPEAVERAIGPSTRALLVSHHFGRPSDMKVWTDLARRRGLAIVEDCAHAFGARVQGRSVGAFGLGGAFSLSLTKGLTGVAGGVVVTADPDVAQDLAARELALPPPAGWSVGAALAKAILGKVLLGRWSYAWLGHLPNVALQHLGADPFDRLMTEQPAQGGVASSTTALHSAFAAIARQHLRRADSEAESRRAAARALIDAHPWRRLRMPAWEEDRRATYLNFVVRTDDPRRLRLRLLRAGFDTRRDYLRAIDDDPGRFPVSARLPREGVYLPIKSLGPGEIDRLAATLRAADT